MAGTWCLFGMASPAVVGGGVPYWTRLLILEPGWPETGLAELDVTFLQDGGHAAFAVNGVMSLVSTPRSSVTWSKRMAALPKRRFDRKGRKLQIELRGDPAFDNLGPVFLKDVTPAVITTGARMVAAGLREIAAGLTPEDGVDLTALIAAADALATRLWPDVDSLVTALRAAAELDTARIKAMDPWSGVDLRGTHRKAKAILDAPSDWDQGNDFAPHGNDLGADIWADWKRVKLQSVDVVAGDYCVSVLGAWGEVQLMLALAFGHVKKTGTCPADLAQAALLTLQDKAQAAEAQIAPQHVAAFRAAVSRYGGILARFADPAGH